MMSPSLPPLARFSLPHRRAWTPFWWGGKRVAHACLLHRFSFQTADVIHRPRYLVGVGTALVFFPLTCVRERSADWRYVSSLAPRRRRRSEERRVGKEC